MNLFRDFLLMLTTLPIPMPRTWTESSGFYTSGTAQIETSVSPHDGRVTSVEQGYKLFHTPLTRGGIKHSLRSVLPGYNFTHLLQLYLIAERDINLVNMLPYLNLAYPVSGNTAQNVFRVPIVAGEIYSIYGNTQYACPYRLFYENAGDDEADVLAGSFPYLDSNFPHCFYLSDEKIASLKDNSIEYLVLEISTPPITSICVVNGKYLSTHHNDENKDLIPRSEETGQAHLVPSLSVTKAVAADKLYSMLLEIYVNNLSDPELRDNLHSIVGFGGDLDALLPECSRGVYDLDGNTDRRIL